MTFDSLTQIHTAMAARNRQLPAFVEVFVSSLVAEWGKEQWAPGLPGV